MDSRTGNERSEVAKEIKRIKDNMGGSVTISCFEFIDNLSLGTDRKSLFREAGS